MSRLHRRFSLIALQICVLGGFYVLYDTLDPGTLLHWSGPRGRPFAHSYNNVTGLLAIDDEGKGRHPILDLIEEAQRDWKTKLARQSTTLKQAYDEYQKRYRRYSGLDFCTLC
jgi:hypothetical protein